jgi:transposase
LYAFFQVFIFMGGKNVFWYGFKGHLAVGTNSQYILQSVMSSGNLNDGKAAIPLLKGLQQLPLSIRYGILDAGYDYVPIYQQIHRMEAHSIIAYNKRNEGEMMGFDAHFAPTCVRGFSYRYDSYDKKYKTLKFVRPKECKGCPLAQDSLCQKVYTLVYNASKLAADRISKELQNTQAQAA